MSSTAFRSSDWDVSIGMPVFSADDHRLGTVTETDAYELLVEDELLVRHVYAINLFDVQQYEPKRLVLKLTEAEAVEQRSVG